MQESIAIKVRNFTGFDLSRESYGLTHGRWGDDDSSAPPSDIPDGGTADFSSESVDELNGTGGFVEYMTTAGTFRLEWTVPLMGDYSLRVTSPPGYEQDTIGDHARTSPSVKVILQPPE